VAFGGRKRADVSPQSESVIIIRLSSSTESGFSLKRYFLISFSLERTRHVLENPDADLKEGKGKQRGEK